MVKSPSSLTGRACFNMWQHYEPDMVRTHFRVYSILNHKNYSPSQLWRLVRETTTSRGVVKDLGLCGVRFGQGEEDCHQVFPVANQTFEFKKERERIHLMSKRRLRKKIVKHLNG